MNRLLRSPVLLLLTALLLTGLPLAPMARAQPAGADGPWRPLFDGETLAGWEGGDGAFRIEDGALVGGRTDEPRPRNAFLCTTETFGDFALRLRFRLTGDGTNAGVQFRSRRIPDDHEVIGYQADLGDGWWGALYDESRRNRVLARPDAETLARALDPDGWNQYDVYANGRRIRTFINGHLMVDYTEPEASVEQHGKVCLQIHSGPPGEAWYRDLRIRAVTPRPETTHASPSPVRFRQHRLTADFISEGVAAADVDRDGDRDVIAGAAWFEAPSWRRHALYDGRAFSRHDGYSDTFVSFPIDEDGDGWTDVVHFDFPGRGAYVYRNPGTEGGPWARREIHPAVRSESPLGRDMDGDGRLDLVFVEAGDGGRVVWLAPPAPGDTAWTVHPVSAPLPAERNGRLAHGMGYGDLDGDGRADIFTTDAWWQAPEDPAGAWTEHPADFGPPAAQLHALDVDGDGDADVVGSSAHAYGIWWNEQVRVPEGGLSWRRHPIDDRLSQMHALAAADIDGDGRKDLVTGDRFFAHNGNDPGEFDPTLLVWYAAGRDAGGRPTWTPHLIHGDVGVGLQLVVEDLTGDGLPDVLTASKKGVHLFEQLPGGER